MLVLISIIANLPLAREDFHRRGIDMRAQRLTQY